MATKLMKKNRTCIKCGVPVASNLTPKKMETVASLVLGIIGLSFAVLRCQCKYIFSF